MLCTTDERTVKTEHKKRRRVEHSKKTKKKSRTIKHSIMNKRRKTHTGMKRKDCTITYKHTVY